MARFTLPRDLYHGSYGIEKKIPELTTPTLYINEGFAPKKQSLFSLRYDLYR